MASVKYALHVQRDGDFDSSPISLSATAVVALIAMGCPILMRLVGNSACEHAPIMTLASTKNLLYNYNTDRLANGRLRIHLADWVAQNTHRRESQERVITLATS